MKGSNIVTIILGLVFTAFALQSASQKYEYDTVSFSPLNGYRNTAENYIVYRTIRQGGSSSYSSSSSSSSSSSGYSSSSSSSGYSSSSSSSSSSYSSRSYSGGGSSYGK